MDVTLIGIDVSDERITVGEIPPIVVDPTKMPAKKGGEKEIQITARPGQPWVFDMPAWLSAMLDGQNIPSGATITHQGPANVVFKTVEANPKAENRSVSFNIEVNGVDQEITIVQAGSTLTKGSDISLDAEAGSEGLSLIHILNKTKGIVLPKDNQPFEVEITVVRDDEIAILRATIARNISFDEGKRYIFTLEVKKDVYKRQVQSRPERREREPSDPV